MLKLAYCYVKGNKRSTFICIAGMALSMTLVFSLIQTAEQSITYFKDMISSDSNYDLMLADIEEEVLTESQLQEITELYGERYDLIRTIYFGKGRISEVSESTMVGVCGDWPTFFMVELQEGRLPNETGDICIEESFAAEKGLKTGMPLRLTLFENSDEGAETEYEFLISGIISDTPSYTSGGYMFTTFDTVQEIQAQEEYQNAVLQNVIYLSIDRQDYPEEDISAVYAELTEKYGMSFTKHIQENKAKYQIGMEKGSYYELSRALYGIVVFLLVILSIFVYYMMRVNLLGKIRQYGVLRSLGMDRFRLAGLIVCEVMLYSVPGILLGCLGGLWLNQVMTELIFRSLIGKSIHVTNYSAGLFISAIGLAFLAVVLASLKIFVDIVHKKPIELLQNSAKNREGRYTTCRNVVLELAWNNTGRNRGKTRVFLITMILALLLVILMGNGLGSMDFDVDKGVVSFANMEISAVRGAGTSYIEDEDFEQLKNLAGEEWFWQAGLFEYRLCEENQEQNTATAVVYSHKLMDRFREINGLKNEEVVLCYNESSEIKMPEKLRLYDGDELLAELLPQAEVSAGRKDLTSGGIPRSRNTLILDEAYAATFLEKPLQITSVYLHSDNLTIGDVKQLLDSEYYEYVDLSNIEEQANRNLKGMLILAGYMMVSMITLAVFLITSTVRENFEQRRGEIGMMRAVGGTKKMVSLILCTEILLNLLVAALLSGVLSVPVSAYVYFIIRGKVGMAWQGYVFGIPVVLLGSMLVVKWNVDHCMRCDTVELLRSEE